MPLTKFQIKKLNILAKTNPEFSHYLIDAIEIWKKTKPQIGQFGSTEDENTNKFKIIDNEIGCCLLGAYRVGKNFDNFKFNENCNITSGLLLGFDAKLLSRNVSDETKKAYNFAYEIYKIVFNYEKIKNAKTIADLNIKYNFTKNQNLTEEDFFTEINKNNPTLLNWRIKFITYTFIYKNSSGEKIIYEFSGHDLYLLLSFLYRKKYTKYPNLSILNMNMYLKLSPNYFL